LPLHHYTYGLGERFTSLHLKQGSYAFWAADPNNNNPNEQSDSQTNYYSSMPSFITVNPNTQNAYGAMMFNSSPMQVELREKYLTYKMTGGVIELLVFNGPRPKEVVVQMQQTFGKPVLPPYSALGWNGYIYLNDAKGDIAQLQDTLKDNQRMLWEGIWIDYPKMKADDTGSIHQLIDSLPDVEFYLNKKSPVEIGSDEHSNATKDDKSLCVKDSDGKVVHGKVGNTNVCFIDYRDPESVNFIKENYLKKNDTFKYSTNKIGIYMNEPSWSCNGNCDNNSTNIDYKLPFTPSSDNKTLALEANTLPFNSVIGPTSETMLNYHNLYSLTEIQKYYTAINDLNERPVIFSRSSFQGMQQYAGKWLGYIIDSWAGLKMSIVQTMNFNVNIIIT
jgi:alpha-glucosidase